jgi:hypothetical protein
VNTLLEVLLCETGELPFFKEECCDGSCEKKCGWNFRGEDCREVDDMLVSWSAYENITGKEDEDDEYRPASSKSSYPSLCPRTTKPSEFLDLFGSMLRAYAAHYFISVHQTEQQRKLKTKLSSLASPVLDDASESRTSSVPIVSPVRASSSSSESSSSKPWDENHEAIIVDMDFAENYEIVHKIEIQSQHWSHQQVTLFIVIAHYRQPTTPAQQRNGAAAFEVVNEAHVVISSDRAHDTYFVQHFLRGLHLHFKRRNINVSRWFFNTDGAASHFKNRYTFEFMGEFKSESGATSVMWETCAPGHGKGPWDGIGAVIKRLLRTLEKNKETYNQGAVDVFKTLVNNLSTWLKEVGGALDRMIVHYIPTCAEEFDEVKGISDNVLGPIKRPKNKPVVTAVPTRNNFCFDFVDGGIIRYRRLSCHCGPCWNRNWADCTNKKLKWTAIKMQKISVGPLAAATSLSSNRTSISKARQQLARACKCGEVIALEAQDDAQGFSFWLAKVVCVAYNTDTPIRIEGLAKKGWFIDVKYIDRFPLDSPTTFHLERNGETVVVNAEGVCARNVQLTSNGRTRGTLSSLDSLERGSTMKIDQDELVRLETAAENSFQHTSL